LAEANLFFSEFIDTINKTDFGEKKLSDEKLLSFFKVLEYAGFSNREQKQVISKAFLNNNQATSQLKNYKLNQINELLKDDMLDPKVCKQLLLKSETKFEEELLCRLYSTFFKNEENKLFFDESPEL
jgi:Asp-tRNA(Asn)/Glu-tRNA(Gln) amidotransferase B subunit